MTRGTGLNRSYPRERGGPRSHSSPFNKGSSSWGIALPVLRRESGSEKQKFRGIYEEEERGSPVTY